MRVVFVGVGSEQLSISLLSSVLKQEGHETSLVFNPALFDYDGFLDWPPLARALDNTDLLVDEVVAAQPDLVAFSVLTGAYRWSVEVAEAVKARVSTAVIFGGVHPSAVPEVCLENDAVDYVCVGEGEEALAALCRDLPGPGQRPSAPIPNLWWRVGDEIVEGPAAPFIADLDALPTYDKALWVDEVRIADDWMTMSGRGCPYRCTFCFNNFFAKLPGKGGGRYLRQRSVEHVIGELTQAKADFGIRRVNFMDDIFTVRKDWVRDFLAEYRREVDLPFQCLVHPRFVDDDIARWLKDAGCEHVQMGVQSVDEDYKRTQLLRMESDTHLRDSLASLDRVGLDLKLDHILGLPGEPLGAQEQARELYAQFPPRRIQTFWRVHLPGVELTTGAVERGGLSQQDYEDLSRGEARSYHSLETAEGPEAEIAAHHRRYELLFRLMTVVPRRFAGRLRAESMPELSPRTGHLFGLALEALNTAINVDTETLNYLRFYRRQVPRQLRRRLSDRRRGRRRRTIGEASAAAWPMPQQASRAATSSTHPPSSSPEAGAPNAPVAVELQPRR